MRSIPPILLFLFLSLAFASTGTKTLCIKNTCIQTEVADDDIARQKGLMFRDKLSDNQGMLFIFEEQGLHNFWMKNMKFSLDIIWINKDKKIVEIQKNASPYSKSCPDLVPSKESLYVLEVNAGFVEKNKIGLGDGVSF